MNTEEQPREDGAAAQAAPPRSLSEKQRRELWLYIAVSIAAVELLIAMGAFLYAFITAAPASSGSGPVIVVPWVAWGAMALMAPTLILLIAHVADVGLFRAPSGGVSEQEWQKLLPDRLQTLYRFIKGAPVAVVLAGLVALGGVLLTLDGAVSALSRLGEALLPHLPWIIGGLAGLGCVIVVAVAWLNYSTRRLIAEYDFRREVLEKTGVIIVDKGSTPLPPGGVSDVPYALLSGEESTVPALPQGEPDAGAVPPEAGAEPADADSEVTDLDAAASDLGEEATDCSAEAKQPRTPEGGDAEIGPDVAGAGAVSGRKQGRKSGKRPRSGRDKSPERYGHDEDGR